MPYSDQVHENWPHTLAYMQAANSEIKTAAALLFAEPGCELTQNEIAARFAEAQGDDSAWVFHRASDAGNMCRTSLAPAKVVESTIGVHDTNWRAQTKHHEETLALGGLFAAWALEYPDISMQDVLPAIPLHNEHPATYFEIHRTLAGYSPLPSSLSTPAAKLIRPLMRLDGIGVITRERQDNNSITVVTGEGATKLIGQPVECEAIWQAVKELGAERRLDLQVIIDYACESGYYPGTPDRLYDFVRSALLPNDRRRFVVGLTVPDTTKQDADPFAGVAFRPEFAEPIKDMLAAVESLTSGDRREIQYYRKTALGILGDPSKFRALVQKGRDFSRFIPKEPAPGE